jgi:hypothetical protein
VIVSYQYRIISGIAYTLIILSLSLYWFRVAGFAVSLSTVFVVYRLFRTKFKSVEVQFMILLFIHAIVALLLQVTNVNFFEFIKTYLLLILAILFFTGIGYTTSKSLVNHKTLTIVYKSLIFLVVAFAFAQVFEFMVYRNDRLFFILDNYSISTAEDAGRFQAVSMLSYYRPISFYHEPSYFGSVALMLLIGSRALDISKKWQIISFIGVVLSLSSTVYFFCLLFVLVEIIAKFYRFRFWIACTIFSFTLMYSAQIIALFRVSEILNPGTSGHERLVVPLFNIWNDMNGSMAYFGIPLGQISIQPNNSLFVLIGYYSFITPLIFMGIYGIIKSWGFSRRHRLNYYVFFGLMLFVNGAIISPESQMILYFLALTLTKAEGEESVLNMTS